MKQVKIPAIKCEHCGSPKVFAMYEYFSDLTKERLEDWDTDIEGSRVKRTVGTLTFKGSRTKDMSEGESVEYHFKDTLEMWTWIMNNLDMIREGVIGEDAYQIQMGNQTWHHPSHLMQAFTAIKQGLLNYSS